MKPANIPLQIASEFVHHTHKNIFLTGKAGTGKTTFLRELKSTLLKRMAIVAPTGVAAINAGGVTIHSFFQLPFGPHVPESIIGSKSIHKYSREKITLVKGLDLLVIDEISMVRADTLDAIDEVLRKYKDRNKPFGGVQLLMIGDLHQLSPVVKDEDWKILRDHYRTAYFFGSRALQQTSPVRIELTHIFRQTDTRFINLLNNVRENRLDTDTLATLNERYIPGFKPAVDEGYITLTTHKANAQKINSDKLSGLLGKSRFFEAEVSGDFPTFNYPTELSLELKLWAQVMFVKNDSSRDKLFYNGKIGQVIRMDSETVYVRCHDDDSELEVKPEEWRNVKYVLNEQTKEIEEQVIGTFKQLPLRLAWAITIHKSQGLTFDKAIIDANESFAHGQVYVALSRCKTLEGMVLSSRIETGSVKTDGTVAAYTREAGQQMPDHAELTKAKIEFQKSQLLALFDFGEIRRALIFLTKLLTENPSVISTVSTEMLGEVKTQTDDAICSIADKFRIQLHKSFDTEILPEEDHVLRDRIGKASSYFLEKMDLIFQPLSGNWELETDNTAVKKSLTQGLEALQKAIFIKMACIKASETSFNSVQQMQIRGNAELDFGKKTESTPSKTAPKSRSGLKNGHLFGKLKEWRNDVAAEHNVLDYMVIPMKTMMEIAEKLPGSMKELEKIKGIGKTKLKRYGEEILKIIQASSADHG